MAWATGVATGLLNGINNQIANERAEAQKNQEMGDQEQLRAFQQAQEEYQQAKNKNADEGTKEETMAKMLAANLGQPIGPWAYATARDAVEMGYDKPEHLPYVLDAAKHTFADQQANPDKWNVPNTTPKSYASDSNPTQTALLRKMGNQSPVGDIENVRNNNVTKNYNGLPGASWGDPNAVSNAALSTKLAVENKAKQDAANSQDAGGWGSYDPRHPDNGGAGQLSPQQSNSIRDAVTSAIPGGADNLPKMPVPPMGPETSSQGFTAQGSANSPSIAVPASMMQPPDQSQGGQPSQPQPQMSMQSDGMHANTPPPPQQGIMGGQAQDQSPQPQEAKPPPSPPPAATVIQPFSPNSPNIAPAKGPQINQDALDRITQRAGPSFADLVMQIDRGEVDLNKLVSTRGVAGEVEKEKWIAAVRSVDPTWDMTTAAGRQKAQVEYNNPDSRINQMALSANKLTNHLSDLNASIDSMGNLHNQGSFSRDGVGGALGTAAVDAIPFGNKAYNQMHAWTAGTADPAFASFYTTRKNVGEESGKFFGGAPNTVHNSEEVSDIFPNNMSPEYGHAGVASMAKSMLDQIIPMQEQQDNIMGPHSKTIADPATIAKLEKLAGVKPGYRPDTPPEDNTQPNQRGMPGHDAKTGAPMRINPATGKQQIWVGPGEPD